LSPISPPLPNNTGTSFTDSQACREINRQSRWVYCVVPNRPEYTPLHRAIFNYKDLTHCGTFDDTSINTDIVYREIRYAGTEGGGGGGRDRIDNTRQDRRRTEEVENIEASRQLLSSMMKLIRI
jgi:hypothetical protein